jgi:sugar phosphate isomerase/epimerase
MPTRRQFLEVSARAAAAGILLRGAGHAQPADGLIYGVQMFMVRKQAATDLAGAFRAIHDAGFNQVELYPVAYTGHTAAQLRRILADSGLSSVSGHFDYTARDSSVDYAHQLGLKFLVCPMLPKEQWTSLDGFRKGAAWFNQWAETARSAGIQFVFHNHDYEFKPMEGSFGFAELMKDTSASLVKLELDLYWLTQAGQDPAAMLRRYADRAVLVHLKDRMANAPTSYTMDEPQHFTELGRGAIAWPALLRQARQQGIRYAFLDQDDTTLPIEESMRQSHEYLQSLHL